MEQRLFYFDALVEGIRMPISIYIYLFIYLDVKSVEPGRKDVFQFFQVGCVSFFACIFDVEYFLLATRLFVRESVCGSVLVCFHPNCASSK